MFKIGFIFDKSVSKVNMFCLVFDLVKNAVPSLVLLVPLFHSKENGWTPDFNLPLFQIKL